MIHFDLQPEPADFDDNVRTPGNQWLQDNPAADRPKDYWHLCKEDLQNAFRDLCAYTAIYEPIGTVDHYISCKADNTKAYEWDNYRYAAQWMNSSKQNADDTVFDPFEVEDGGFEIILPSCQLKVSDTIPQQHRAKAEHTLKRLHLAHDERVIRTRTEWYQMYVRGELNLEGLRKKAPLIARAVEGQAQMPGGT